MRPETPYIAVTVTVVLASTLKLSPLTPLTLRSPISL
jgi:hypothetical protein